MTPEHDSTPKPAMSVEQIIEVSARAWDRLMLALADDRAPNEALRRAAGRRVA